MTACLDDHVGILEKALKEKGLWDNTVFIFSSGEALLCASMNLNVRLCSAKFHKIFIHKTAGYTTVCIEKK